MPEAPNHEAARRILATIAAIPEGWVRTYGDINPTAPRFTGNVLAHADVDVPWWRVVRSDGTLANGERQRALLEAEGVPFAGHRVDLSVARLPERND